MSRNSHKTAIITATICSGLATLGLTSATVSALEYQSDPVELKFEFGQTLTISTDGNISIASLTPGTKAISNSNYNVTVSTNNLTGYTLSATVGCSSGTDCYDSKNLSDGTNNFTMLSADGTLTSGTWGVSLDSSATANSTFKTLAKYDETATTINKTTNNTGTAATGYTGTANTTVRVGAYATTSQVAGTYTNSINFIAVANAIPMTLAMAYADAGATQLNGYYKMQDMTSSICGAVEVNEDQLQVIDTRDEKIYWIAKLADGNCWMTQNLDHDIVTTAGYYTPQNTDIPSAWTPSTATYATNDDTWNASSTAPESYDPGDLCWDGTIDWDGALDDETTTCGSDKHMHIGNYYNWTAAVAMNNSSSYTAGNTDVDQSICPAGWMLPKSGTTQTGSKSFQYLWNQYSSSFNQNTMMNSPLYFSYAGEWADSSFGVGGFGVYWSSVVDDSDSAYGLYFEPVDGVYPQSSVYPQRSVDRYYSYSIRCVAR